jgi:predicted RNA binding protein YcfA (HicA-like mRNA interferase family)
MPHKVKDVVKSLLKKGFVESEGSRHRKFKLYDKSARTSVATVISHGESELREVLAGVVARQLHLNTRQLDDLVKCPMSHDEYLSILRQKGILDSSADRESLQDP